MRSWRALRLIQSSSQVSHGLYTSPKLQTIRNGYCSVCEPATAPVPEKIEVESTTRSLQQPADHRKLGIEQDLFTTSIYSPGSPLFLPNGTKLFNKLTNFLRAQYEQFGFEEVITPTIYKKSLWEKSGHWENYAEDMYAVTGRGAAGEKEGRQVGEDEEYGLKPMNCPGHCLIFASRPRSYRDLPIRYADFSPLHRNEVHGALSGLTRVRRFHQDDGHIFCRPSQIQEEISKTLEFVRMTYKVLGLGPYRLALSTRPSDHFIGTVDEWDNAEDALKSSLDTSGLPWTLNEGDGAFYGPKIDIILKDSDAKEHQTATIQLDFQLPQRFELEYQAPAPHQEQRGLVAVDAPSLSVQGPVTPVLIHRAVLGSVERIMALLIEHYNGKWPFWLNPRQVIILTVNDTPPVVKCATRIVRTLRGLSGEGHTFSGVIKNADRLSVEIDDSPRSVRKKLSEAKRKRFAIVIVVGTQDVNSNNLTVDFSGIPDPEDQLCKMGILRQCLAARVAKKQGQGVEWDSSVTADSKNLPNLEPDQLKDVIIDVGRLKRFLETLQQINF
jgi:threonyl-tRNA synthetase